MLLEDLNWMGAEAYLQHEDRLVLVTGACEQHAYCSLLTDIRIPYQIAAEACRRTNVLVAPPLNYGISPYFTTYPGTLSLRPETFALVVRELLEGWLAQGFRGILVSNGHGGNTSILATILTELANAHPELRTGLYQWWLHPAVVAVADAHGLPMNHANWEENFTFTRVAASPRGSKPTVHAPRTARAAEVRRLAGDGNYGGPYQVDDSIMGEMFAAAVDAMVADIDALAGG